MNAEDAKIRTAVLAANRALAETGLVRWSSGNASARNPRTGGVLIKPSGVKPGDLNDEDLVEVDLDGRVLAGHLKPSVDTASHLFVYRRRPDVNGIVHTHSRFATAFAVAGMPLPVTTTTHACFFGEPIPVSGLAAIGEEEIGREIVEQIGSCTAILMRNHGVFTIGASVEEALKYAVYAEESAEASYLSASLIGAMPPPLSEQAIRDARTMYLETYGQRPKGRSQ